ncbi:hypothetical protein btf_1465 [Dehalococcoides mccartyi BTF08]|nr:hypothetical protein btf_1465 [Dehalococcoides mccartyi BTF08]
MPISRIPTKVYQKLSYVSMDNSCHILTHNLERLLNPKPYSIKPLRADTRHSPAEPPQCHLSTPKAINRVFTQASIWSNTIMQGDIRIERFLSTLNAIVRYRPNLQDLPNGRPEPDTASRIPYVCAKP